MDDPVANQTEIDSLIAIEGLIKNSLVKIKSATEETSRLKEMHDDILVNDQAYSAAEAAAKEAVNVKAAAKKEALGKPEAESIVAKLKSARSQLKELKDSLSKNLREYERLSGSNQIEVEAGDIRQIIYQAKLIKASESR